MNKHLTLQDIFNANEILIADLDDAIEVMTEDWKVK